MTSVLTETDLLESTACPVCQHKDFTVVYPARYPQGLTQQALLEVYSASSERKLMDQLVRCSHCTLGYLNPRVRSDIILSSYSGAVDPAFFEQNAFRIATFRRSLKWFVNKFQLSPQRSRKVLDIGCAGGAFPKAADELGFSVTGIEPSAWLAEQGRQTYHLDIRAGVLSDFSFPDASFFIVTLWDVLEHVIDPNAVLQTIHRLLDPQGYLLINVPNSDSLVARVLGRYWPFLLSVHLYYFTPATLGRLLHQHGFEVVAVKSHFQILSLGYVLKRAAAYLPGLDLLERLARAVKMDRLPLAYNLGQSTFVARKSTR